MTVHCEVIQALERGGTINIFVICLDKPNSEVNIIDKEFALSLARALYHAKDKAESGELNLVVVCSAKQGSFLAGADIDHELKFTGPSGTLR